MPRAGSRVGREGDMHTGPAPLPRVGREARRRRRRRRRRTGCSGTSVLQDGFVGLVDVLGHLRRPAFQGQLWGEQRRGGHGPSPHVMEPPAPHAAAPIPPRGSPSSFLQLDKGPRAPQTLAPGLPGLPPPGGERSHPPTRREGRGAGRGTQTRSGSLPALQGERFPQRHPPLQRSKSPLRLFAQKLIK